MGTKRTRTPSQDEYVNKLSVPPGFASLTSFRLRKVESSEQSCSSMASASAHKGDQIQMDSTFNEIDVASLKRSLCHKPWMLNCQNKQNQQESDSEQVVTDPPSTTLLPRGVVHGCPDCSNCLKVMARWHGEDARTDILEEAPVFYPTEEEFKDTINYIASICPKAEAYGICRIVPPLTWDPPCLVKEKNIWETSSFATQIQRVDGLQKHHLQGKIAGIYANGSCKRRSSSSFDSENGVGNGCTDDTDGVGCSDIESFESETGPEFTLETFQKYADDFKSQYFSAKSNKLGPDVDSAVDQESWEPSLDDIEGEYRRIIENPTMEIEVFYGGELDSGVFGSGFPIKSHFSKLSDHHDYLNSGWNLNNTPRLPGSLLSFESFKTSGVLVPQLKIGMCFSSFYWKVAEHHLYSLCYMHLGAPKIWYAIPGRYNIKFEAVMEKHFPELVGQPKLRDRLISKLSLSMLKSENMPVYRCIQHPGEFVLVFPGAYYSGFDSGFNCAEAVNVASIDWLPHGQHVVELYCEKGRKTLISHDKMLLGAVTEAIRAQWEVALFRKNASETVRWKGACGKDSILAKALRSRIKLEGNRREYLCTSLQSQRMDQKFDAIIKRECSICFYDLHLSAARCRCSADRYSCLNHSKQLCSCAWSEKIFLFRYEINELNTLLEALEGKVVSVYQSAREVLKLSLFSSNSEDSSYTPGCMDDLDSQMKNPEEKVFKSKHAVRPKSSVSSINAEIKARMVQLRSLNRPKQRQKSSTSKFATSASAEDPVLILTSESSSESWASESANASSSSDSWE